MATKKTTQDPVSKFLEKANKQLKKDIEFDKHNRLAAVDDLKFQKGDQWDEKVIQERKSSGRPCLTMPLLQGFVDQVGGDIRQNTPIAKVEPADAEGDVHIARIRAGKIADIEHQSNALSIYKEAGVMSTGCGYGAWRILTRRCENNPFVKESYLEAIENPFTVVMDSGCKSTVHADATRCFILDKMSRDEFSEKWPDATPPGEELKPGPGMTYEHWFEKDSITVAEYFIREKVSTPMCQMEDGTVLTKEHALEKIKEWEEKNKELVSKVENTPAPQVPGATPAALPPGSPALPVPGAAGPQGGGPLLPPELAALGSKPKIIKEADAEVWKVKHYVITATEILSKNELDGEDFPGSYIPVILVLGKRLNIEGKRHIMGLVRNAKDAQRNVNYWYTACAERVALEPKAPWIGTPTQFEGFEEDFAKANIDNKPFLMYHPDMSSGQLAPPPQRMGPGQAPVAMFQQLQMSIQMLKDVIGMQGAASTESGPERTGAAVTKKQASGDTGTFVYIDNLHQNINHSSTILNDIMDEIHDTSGDMRLRNLDESESYVPVNTTVGKAIEAVKANPLRYKGMNTVKLVKMAQEYGLEAKFNHINKGQYRVTTVTGPSFATQRSESAEAMLRLASALPKQMGLAVDLIAKNIVLKDFDVLAERLKKTLPPGMATPAPGEDPPKPLPPPPQVVLAQEKVKLEQEKVQIARAKLEVEKIKMMKELQGEKGEIKKMMLEILAELHSPAHPADQMMMNQLPAGPQGGMQQ